jgi:2-C-methyl-D-erythritol 4-phosphate cytidylyltransferase
MKKTIAIIVAAGSSTRMGGDTDKVFAKLGGKPVLLYSLQAFQAASSIDEIVIVARKNSIGKVCGLYEAHGITKVASIVEGGSGRAASVQNGLNSIKRRSGVVAIHDAARPFITPPLIDEAVAAAKEYMAAILAVPAKDTVKIVEELDTPGFVDSTPNRHTMYLAQTPQVFDLALYRQAVKSNSGQNQQALAVTDDSTLIEREGIKVRLVQGDYRNIKITTPEDLKIAEIFLEAYN